uniref:UPAR/Ly6 domain-containing protein n=1 Tax=Meloidogyne floridensis TaxID=298350 RepID=A0A915PAV9_9BILA
MFFINNVFRYTFCLSFEYNKIESKADENTEEGNNVKDNSTVQCYLGGGVGFAKGKRVIDCSDNDVCLNFTASLNHTESNNTLIKALHTGNNKDVAYACSVGYICPFKNACGKTTYKGEYGEVCCCNTNLCNGAQSKTFISSYFLIAFILLPFLIGPLINKYLC